MKNSVREIIQAQGREEFKAFRQFLASGKGASGRKDLRLAEELRRGDDVPKGDLNAYRLTKKRLKRQLERFALLHNAGHSTISRIYNFIEMARYLSDKNLYLQAWEYLYKAEQEALKHEEYELLNFIYYIQVSYYAYRYLPDESRPDILELLHKHDTNSRLARMDANGNSAFALLTFELSRRLSTNFIDEENILINKVLVRYNLEDEIYASPKIYSRIVNIVCWALTEKKEYEKLRVYALRSYEEMQSRHMLNKVPHDFLMEFLSILCLSLVRTRDYETFAVFSQVYEKRTLQYKSQQDKYITYDFRSRIMAADLYMLTGKFQKAKSKLLLLQKDYSSDAQPLPIYFILRVNMIAMHFSEGDYNKCLRCFAEITQQNIQKKVITKPGLGVEIVLLTEIYSALFYFELEDFDDAGRLLKSLKRRYSYALDQKDRKRENLFLQIMEKMLNKASYAKSASFRSDVDRFVRLKTYIPGDKEYISLNAWLLSKRSGRTYYECFLGLASPEDISPRP